MAQCPNCGGKRFKYELRSAGSRSKTNYYRTGVKSSWIIPAGQRTNSSQRNQKSVGICPDCGYVLDKEAQMNANIGAVIVIAILLLLGYRYLKEQRQERDVANENVWPSAYTSLDDFKYYIENGEIHLKDYKGKSDKVRIAGTYIVNGKSCTVVELDSTFALDNVISVVVPEGVREMSINVFNSCGIKYVYLPSTLKEWNGWNYFHDMKKIYYGGSETQWKSLYDGKREDIDVEEIIFDTDESSLH